MTAVAKGATSIDNDLAKLAITAESELTLSHTPEHTRKKEVYTGLNGKPLPHTPEHTRKKEVAIKVRLNEKWFRSRKSSFRGVIEYIKQKLLPPTPNSMHKEVRFEMHYFVTGRSGDKVYLCCEQDFQKAVDLMCTTPWDTSMCKTKWDIRYGRVEVPLMIFVSSNENKGEHASKNAITIFH